MILCESGVRQDVRPELLKCFRKVLLYTCHDDQSVAVNGSLFRLHSADLDAVSWLTSYGS